MAPGFFLNIYASLLVVEADRMFEFDEKKRPLSWLLMEVELFGCCKELLEWVTVWWRTVGFGVEGRPIVVTSIIN
jgi:hypothetical protein